MLIFGGMLIFHGILWNMVDNSENVKTKMLQGILVPSNSTETLPVPLTSYKQIVPAHGLELSSR